MLKFNKKRIVVSHRHATKANALIGDNNVFYFQTMIVFRKYIVIDCKNCNFAIENEIFDCRKFTFASFFLRIWNQDRRAYPLSMYIVRAYSIS